MFLNGPRGAGPKTSSATKSWAHGLFSPPNTHVCCAPGNLPRWGHGNGVFSSTGPLPAPYMCLLVPFARPIGWVKSECTAIGVFVRENLEGPSPRSYPARVLSICRWCSWVVFVLDSYFLTETRIRTAVSAWFWRSASHDEAAESGFDTGRSQPMPGIPRSSNGATK